MLGDFQKNRRVEWWWARRWREDLNHRMNCGDNDIRNQLLGAKETPVLLAAGSSVVRGERGGSERNECARLE
ncbi:hypothetical protein E2C01_030022 [Portunus trituberculatus]|uniref:Uncharacterized protein n=1 Tax=Portunus trituberculatus TaxID=210409 RepID=A0A5B7EU16_PORTR|nr:hypothetical protein [Portunus trituberculatus]